MNISLHSLESLVIVNTNISTIKICEVGKEVVGLDKDKDENDVINCDYLSNLKSLDLRGNKLTSLSEFHLNGLKELYLSGKI